MSAFYFDIKKDTLYCDDLGSDKRKNTITVLKYLFYFLIKWLSPILVFTTEEIFGIIKKENDRSIFLVNFNYLNKLVDLKNFDKEKWYYLKNVRSEVNNQIEIMRNKKEIGSSLETKIKMNISEKFAKYFENIDLSDFFITSGAKILTNDQIFDKVLENKNIKDLKILLEKADGKKCPRCWKYFKTITDDNKELCKRCESVQSGI